MSVTPDFSVFAEEIKSFKRFIKLEDLKLYRFKTPSIEESME